MAQPASIHWRLAHPDEPLRAFLQRGDWMTTGTLVKENDRRAVYRVEPEGAAVPALFIKHDHPRRWHDRLKSLWRCKARIEFDAGMALAAAKVPCVPVLAFGSRGSQSWLVTRAVPRAVKFWPAWRRCAKDPARRGQFIRGWSRLLRRLRAAGVVHHDLHRGNILVRREGDSLRFFLVDLYDAAIAPDKPDDRLRGIMSSLGPMVRLLRPDELDALLRAAGAGGWTDDPGAGAMWRKVLAPTSARFAHHRGKRAAKLLGRGRLCRRIQTRDGLWLLRRPFPQELAERAVAEHRRLRSEASETLLHRDDARSVSRVTLGKQRLIVHELRRGPRTDESPARRRWLNAYAVFGPGLHVARHLAWLAGSDGADYLVCEHLAGPTLAESLARDPADPRRLLAAAGQMLARMHDIGIAFRLKASQIIVRDQAANPLHALGQIHAEGAIVLDRVGDADRAADLACLAASLPTGVGRLARARLFAAYRRWADLARAKLRMHIAGVSVRHPA